MSHKSYIAKRIAWTVFATWVTVTFTFLFLELSPMSTVESQFVQQQIMAGTDPETAKKLAEERFGSGGSLFGRYTTFMWGLLTLDWGWSYSYNKPVLDVILETWPYSIQYGVPATIISVVIGYSIGLYSATHQYTKEDYAATFFAFSGISIPNFWFAIMLILLGGVHLGWFPTYYQSEVPMFSLENARQLFLPMVVVVTAAVASEMRYSRAESLEYVQAEFVKTARAKGLPESRITLRHIFRPALVPLITLLVGDILGILFTSSYIVEVIFGIPGIGLVSYEAIIQQDTSLVLATTLVPVFIAIFGNLIQDIAYTVLDPRIDFSDR